jgi:hypothetical protein
MSNTFSLKRNDTLPRLRAVLSDSSGPVDLTGCSVKFIYKAEGKGQPVSRTAAVLSDPPGTVEYQWVIEDTAVSGNFSGEWEVTFPSGRKLTFPNENYIKFTILPDLG